MRYEFFCEETATATDKAAWILCQIIDDDAPLRWMRYRAIAKRIAKNEELISALLAIREE